MKVHELLGCLKEGRIVIPHHIISSAFSKKALERVMVKSFLGIYEAPKFFFGDKIKYLITNEELTKTVEDFVFHGVFRLPFPETYFEAFSVNQNLRLGILAKETTTSKDGFFCTPAAPYPIIFNIFLNDGKNWVLLGPEVAFRIINGEVLLFSSAQGAPSKIQEDLVFECVKLALCGVIAIQARGTRLDTVPAPVKLNKARAAKNRLPLCEYKQLIINNHAAAASSESRGGTHASPRLHFRRGHIRILPSGQKTTVAACVVGSKELGEIVKDYEVKI